MSVNRLLETAVAASDLDSAVEHAVRAGMRATSYDVGLDSILYWEHARILEKSRDLVPGDHIPPRFQQVKKAFDEAWTKAYDYKSDKHVMTRVGRSESGIRLLTMVDPEVKVGDFRRALIGLSVDLMGM